MYMRTMFTGMFIHNNCTNLGLFIIVQNCAVSFRQNVHTWTMLIRHVQTCLLTLYTGNARI